MGEARLIGGFVAGAIVALIVGLAIIAGGQWNDACENAGGTAVRTPSGMKCLKLPPNSIMEIDP